MIYIAWSLYPLHFLDFFFGTLNKHRPVNELVDANQFKTNTQIDITTEIRLTLRFEQ